MTHFARYAASGMLALGLVLATATPAAADHASISGTVTTTSGKPIADVCVKLGTRQTASCWTYTDANGRYFVGLTDAPDGMTWQLQFVHRKYATVLTEPFVVDGPTVRDQTLLRR